MGLGVSGDRNADEIFCELFNGGRGNNRRPKIVNTTYEEKSSRGRKLIKTTEDEIDPSTFHRDKHDVQSEFNRTLGI